MVMEAARGRTKTVNNGVKQGQLRCYGDLTLHSVVQCTLCVSKQHLVLFILSEIEKRTGFSGPEFALMGKAVPVGGPV